MRQLPPLRLTQRVTGIRSAASTATGQSLVEFAVTLPILLMLLVGILDMGRLYFAYMTVVNAAREGARAGAMRPLDTNGIKARAVNEAFGSTIALTTGNVDSPVFPDGSSAAGNSIQVTVHYNFQMFTIYLFGGTTIPLTASAQMEIFGQ